jgi:ABC-type glycerol-3-phosphate transport system permease component
VVTTVKKPGLVLRKTFGRALTYLVLVVGSIMVMAPLIWMVSTSLKLRAKVFIFPPELIPNPVMWSNYPEALTKVPFLTFGLNTVTITVLAVLGEVISSAIVAYAFSRLRWPGRNTLFIFVLATMMLPGQVTMIPVFILFKEINWLDTFLPLIVPSWFGVPFYIFLLRQFFMTISFELDDAAAIDGCSKFATFWRITLPLSLPSIASVAIFSFQFHWNDFFRPLIYLFNKENYTLAMGLRYFSGVLGTDWHYLMAASLVVMAPLVLIFFFAQKIFIQGVVYTGYK